MTEQAEPSYQQLLAAVFAYTPPPTGVFEWTARLVCARTREFGPVGVSESQLSQMRSGIVTEVSFGFIVSLANAFGVDVAFFTRTCHGVHRDLMMRERVWRAPWDKRQCTLATTIVALPQSQREAILSLVDVLAWGRG